MISRCKLCKNGFFNTFFPFYFETRPSRLSKIGENAFGAHFLQLCRKNEYSDPHFLFHDFIKDSASFRWEKSWLKSMLSFLVILLNCTDWAIKGRIARVQFNSTLERKVKIRALKGIFLVRKWIKNTSKSNSVRYHMHHGKNLSFLSSFGLRGVFAKGCQIAVFVSIVTSKQARWPPLFITFLSYSWLVTSVYQVSSTIYVTLFYWGITSNTKTIENREHFIPFITSNDFRRLCPFGFVMPTSKQKYHCFLILVQNFSACTSRIYSLIVSDTNFYQFGHTFSF